MLIASKYEEIYAPEVADLYDDGVPFLLLFWILFCFLFPFYLSRRCLSLSESFQVSSAVSLTSVYIVDGAYTRDQILDAEEDLLASLGFNLSFVSPLHFLRRFSKAAGSDYLVHTLCKYIIEITTLDVRLLKYA
jgi:hypothetical protein